MVRSSQLLLIGYKKTSYIAEANSVALLKMELLATMVNGRKILTIVTKNSTLDVPRFLWRRAYIRDVN